MLVSHRKQFIFTKTVKTAGTSVESFFEKYCMPEGTWTFAHLREEFVSKAGIIGFRGKDATGKTWYHHMPAAAIREKLGPLLWDSYYKFSVVRNPFDKVISGFYWLCKPKDWAVKNDPIHSFRHWICSGGAATDAYMVDRDKYVVDGKICIDYFVRYENLNHGIKHVCDTLDIPFYPEGIPKLKAGHRPQHYVMRDYYDAETIYRVSRLYEYELEAFGYQPPIPS